MLTGGDSGVAAVEQTQRSRPMPLLFATSDISVTEALRSAALVLRSPIVKRISCGHPKMPSALRPPVTLLCPTTFAKLVVKVDARVPSVGSLRPPGQKLAVDYEALGYLYSGAAFNSSTLVSIAACHFFAVAS